MNSSQALHIKAYSCHAGISTINLMAAVKNEFGTKLKTDPKSEMEFILRAFSGVRSKPYICYSHKDGNNV
jgi:hypothetical protein